MARRSLHLSLFALLALLPGCGLGTAGVVAASDSDSSSSNAKTVGSQPEVTDDDIREERALASPAAIRFALTDQEGDAADVVIEFSEDGVDFDPITLAAGSASLTQVPSNQGSEVLWDFAADLPNGEGYTGDITIKLEVVGGISPEDTTGIEVGNDVPTFTPPTFDPEISGIVPVRFSVEDTEADSIEIKIEYQIDGDTNWFLARDAELSDPLDTGDAFAVDTDADGDEEVFFWNTGFATAYEDSDGDEVVTEGSVSGVLAKREVSVRLRFTLREAFSQAESSRIVELVEGPLLVDNNDAPLAFFDNVFFVLGPDETRAVAIPFDVQDEESDPVQVIFQWKRTVQPGFPHLPNDPAQIEAILADPGRRDELQICTEAPQFFSGRSMPPPASLNSATHLSLPELSGGASALLSGGLDGLTLEILRASQIPESLTSTWGERGFTNPLENPVDALPIGSGPTALVLEATSGGSWCLREIDLATGEVVGDIAATGPGNPTAMDYEPESGTVVVASNMGSIWQVHRVVLPTSTSTPLLTAHDGETEVGPIRDIASIGTGAALATVGNSLIRLDYDQPPELLVRGSGGEPEPGRAPPITDFLEREFDVGPQQLPPRAITLMQDLATPWGVVTDPLRAGRVYLAERDHDHGDGRVGRIVTLELDTYAILDVFLNPAAKVPGAGFDRPTAIALERNGAQLLAVTDSNPGDSVHELRGVRIHGPDPGAVFELTTELPTSASALTVGSEHLRLVTAGGDLFVGGGIEQRRLLAGYDPASQTAQVAEVFEPVPAPNAPWRVAKVLGLAPSSPEGTANIFVWNTADVLGGEVQLRITPIDTDTGVGAEGQAAKRLSLFEDVIQLGDPNEGGVSSAFGDVNGDGRPDVVADNLCEKGIDLFYQSTPEGLSPQPDVRLGIGMVDAPGFTRVVDLNGDGRLDVVTGAGVPLACSLPNTLGLSRRLFLFHQPPGGFTNSTSWRELGAESPWVDDILDVDVADLDRDGFPDIVATSGTFFPTGGLVDVLAIFYQGADGFRRFDQPEVIDPLPRFQDGILVRTKTADMNADGWIDLACQAFEKREVLAMVLLRRDSGFAPPLLPRDEQYRARRVVPRVEPDVLLVGGGGGGIEAVDLDLDGLQDLSFAAGNPAQSLFELGTFFQHQEAPVRFSPFPDFSVSDLAMSSAVDPFGADIDGDGRLDLVATSPTTSSLTVFRQRARRRFSTSADVVRTTGETQIQHAEAVDLEGDGRLDLSSIGYVVLIDRQSSPGSFPADPGVVIADAVLMDRPSFLTAADLNGDGCTDLVSTNEKHDNVTLFLQGIPGQYSPFPDLVLGSRGGDAESEGSTPRPQALALTDLNGDGRIDVVCGNQDAIDVAIFIQPVAGFVDAPFADPEISLDAISGLRDVAAMDLNGDGLVDLVTANEDGDDATILFQNVVGGFPSAPSVTLGNAASTPAPRSLAVADVNADGWLDIVLSDVDANLLVFIQPAGGWGSSAGTPSLTLSSGQVTGSSVLEGRGQVVACDVDVDGLLDLAVPLEVGGGLALFYQPDDGFENEAAPSLALGVTSSRILRPSDLAVADLDADGLPDLVSSNLADSQVMPSQSGSRNTTVFMQSAPGRFSTAPDRELVVAGGIFESSELADHQALVVADLNGDGEPDVASALRRPPRVTTEGPERIVDLISIFFNGK